VGVVRGGGLCDAVADVPHLAQRLSAAGASRAARAKNSPAYRLRGPMG
jgi:hypothetical protein